MMMPSNLFLPGGLKNGDGSQHSPLSLHWPWVEVLLSAAGWALSSTFPSASTHTTLTKPEVLLLHAARPPYHRWWWNSWISTGLPLTPLQQERHTLITQKRWKSHLTQASLVLPGREGHLNTACQKCKSRFPIQALRRVRVGAAVFSKSILSPRLSFSRSSDYREQAFLEASDLSPLMSPGCYFFRPKSGIYVAKRNPGHSALCHFSGPDTPSHHTFFSPPFSLVCFLTSRVFSYT